MRRTIKTWRDAMVVHIFAYIAVLVVIGSFREKLGVKVVLVVEIVSALILALVILVVIKPKKRVAGLSDEYMLRYDVHGVAVVNTGNTDTHRLREALKLIEKYIEDNKFSYNKENLYDILCVRYKSDNIEDIEVIRLQNTRKSTIVGILVNDATGYKIDDISLSNLDTSVTLDDYLNCLIKLEYIKPIDTSESSRKHGERGSLRYKQGVITSIEMISREGE